MKRVILLVLVSVILFSCKKGFVLKSAQVREISSVINTDEIINYELITDAYYKGKKIEPSSVKWTIIDGARVNYQVISSNTKNMTWKPNNPGEYEIKAEFEFDTKDNNKSSKQITSAIFPSFNFLKQKVIGNFTNSDKVNQNYDFDFSVNADFSINGKIDTAVHKRIFYLAQNDFSGCSINIVSADLNGKLQGTIVVHDSATNNLRTDLLRNVIFENAYNTISFKQLYANDTNRFKTFKLARK